MHAAREKLVGDRRARAERDVGQTVDGVVHVLIGEEGAAHHLLICLSAQML